MITTNPIQRRDYLILGIVALIAALMRFAQAGVVEFFHDDAMLSTLALEMSRGGIIPTTGILSSVGIPNPPASVYVMAIPFALSSHPMVAIAFIMALNVLGVALLWLIAHRYFGRRVAVIAALAYALNPWAILYSRKIWAQDYHTPFFLLALLLGLYGFWEARRDDKQKRRLWAQVLCLPVWVFAMQIHFAAWFLLPLYLALLWFGRRALLWRRVALSIALTALVLAPYAVGLHQTLTQDPNRIVAAAQRSEARIGLTFSGQTWLYNLYLMSGLGIETWLAPADITNLANTLPVIRPAGIIAVAFIIIGFAALWRDGQRARFWLLALWYLLPFIAFTPQWTAIYPHYFIASIPGGLLALAIGADVIASRLPPNGRWGLYSSLAIIGLSQALSWRAALNFVNRTEIPYPGFTTPLHYLEAIRAELSSDADVVVISHGMWWLHHHESAVWPVLLYDSAHCVRTIKEGYAVLPSGPFAVLEAPDAPDGYLQRFYKTAEGASWPTRAGAEPYRIIRHPSAPQWSREAMVYISPARWESGVEIVGYALTEDRLTLEWRLPSRNPNIQYQYSAQFLNSAGERIAQYDALFWYGRHWCAGDRLITWAEMDIPDDAQTLRLSLYTLGTGKDEGQYFSANIVDALGNPAGQWVDIPLS